MSKPLYFAAINCAHSITDESIVLHFDPSKPGHNALNQLGKRLDEVATEIYAEGRKDEREELVAVIRAAGFDLITAPSGHQFLLNVQDEKEAL